MPRPRRGRDSPTQAQSLRDIDRSSALSPSDADASRGSSAMPREGTGARAHLSNLGMHRTSVEGLERAWARGLVASAPGRGLGRRGTSPGISRCRRSTCGPRAPRCPSRIPAVTAMPQTGSVGFSAAAPGLSSVAGLTRRPSASPRKIAVPTRTSVEPSRIASSKSADIPIDSSGSGAPSCSRAPPRAAAAPRRTGGRPGPRGAGTSGRGARRPGTPQPLAELERRLRRDPALLRLAADVDLDERRQRAAPGPLRQLAGERGTVDGVDERTATGATYLALLACRWPMKCQRSSVRSASARALSRSSWA